ncbi:hypothetical protein NPIL_93671, partial [Nephila pilipes]
RLDDNAGRFLALLVGDQPLRVVFQLHLATGKSTLALLRPPRAIYLNQTRECPKMRGRDGRKS